MLNSYRLNTSVYVKREISMRKNYVEWNIQCLDVVGGVLGFVGALADRLLTSAQSERGQKL